MYNSVRCIILSFDLRYENHKFSEFFENLHFYILFFREYGINIKKSIFYMLVYIMHITEEDKNEDCLKV